MGGVVGIDAGTKDEIEQAIKTTLATFTKEYIKSYAVHLVKKIKEDAQAEPEDWKLEEREPSKEDRKTWMGYQGRRCIQEGYEQKIFCHSSRPHDRLLGHRR